MFPTLTTLHLCQHTTLQPKCCLSFTCHSRAGCSRAYQGARPCRWCSAGLAGSCQPGNVHAPQPAGSLLLEPAAVPGPYQNLCHHRTQFANGHQNRCTWLTRQQTASRVQSNCGTCCNLYCKVHQHASEQMTQTRLHSAGHLRNENSNRVTRGNCCVCSD